MPDVHDLFCAEHNHLSSIICVPRFAHNEKLAESVKMKEIGQIIRTIRLAQKKKLADVADEIAGFDAASLSRFERGQQGIATDKLFAVAKVLGIPLSDLYARAEGRELPNALAGPAIYARVPLLSSVQAGQWREIMGGAQIQEMAEWVATTAKVSPYAYALRITGDSMEPLLPNGAVVIVDPDAVADNGKIVVVRQNGNEATVKKLVIEGSKQYLQPINPRYPILEANQDAVFCGVVKQVVLDL